jgi:hypothetical protein
VKGGNVGKYRKTLDILSFLHVSPFHSTTTYQNIVKLKLYIERNTRFYLVFISLYSDSWLWRKEGKRVMFSIELKDPRFSDNCFAIHDSRKLLVRLNPRLYSSSYRKVKSDRNPHHHLSFNTSP